jgi:hypothetical protein
MPSTRLAIPGQIAQAFAEPATVSVANINSDGTGTLATLHTAPNNGCIVTSVVFTAQVTTTAGMLRLYHNDGTTTRLIGEVPVTAYTKSASVAGWTGTWTPPGGSLVLGPACLLKASTHNGEAFTAVANGSDY